jgi:hypothetical protein
MGFLSLPLRSNVTIILKYAFEMTSMNVHVSLHLSNQSTTKNLMNTKIDIHSYRTVKGVPRNGTGELGEGSLGSEM